MKEKPLYEIVYQSFSVDHIQLADLNELMVLAKVKNSTIDITGCLVYHNRTFIQVIEGSEDNVKELFGKIKLDKRHTKVEIVWEGVIQERGFNGWSMSLFNLSDKRFHSIFSNFLDTGTLDYDVKGIMTTSKALLKEMKDDI